MTMIVTKSNKARDRKAYSTLIKISGRSSMYGAIVNGDVKVKVAEEKKNIEETLSVTLIVSSA